MILVENREIGNRIKVKTFFCLQSKFYTNFLLSLFYTNFLNFTQVLENQDFGKRHKIWV